jgi:hypothetical protein
MSKIEVWVKADDRLPDENLPRTFFCTDNGRRKILTINGICDLREIAKVEWLDELAITTLQQDNARLTKKVAELNDRGTALTRDFNHAKKLLNHYMKAIEELKFK